MSNRFRTSNVTLGVTYPDGRQPTRLETDYGTIFVNLTSSFSDYLTSSFVTPAELSAAIDDIDAVIGSYVPSSSFTSGTIISMITGNIDNRYILTSSIPTRLDVRYFNTASVTTTLDTRYYTTASVTTTLDTRYIFTASNLGVVQNLSTSFLLNGGLFISGLYRGTSYGLILSSSAFRQIVVAGAGTSQANIRMADINAQGGFVSFTSGAALTEKYSIGKRFDEIFVISDNSNNDFFQYANRGSSGVISLNSNTRFGINSTPSSYKFEIQSLSQSNDGIHLYSATEGNRLLLNPSFGPGSFSPLMQRGDAGIIFYSGNLSERGAFTIAQWGSAAKGLRIENGGYVGINLISASSPLSVQGDLSSSGQAIFAGGYKVQVVSLSLTSSMLSGTQNLRSNLYGIRVPWSGSIAGLSAVASAVQPVGTMYLRAQIQGGDVAGTILTASSVGVNTNPYTAYGRGIFTFSAGDILGVAINTQNFVQSTGTNPFVGYFITMWAYM